jgi:hypothetical protein
MCISHHDTLVQPKDKGIGSVFIPHYDIVMQPKDESILWGQYFCYTIVHSNATEDENTASVFILHRDIAVQPKYDNFQKFSYKFGRLNKHQRMHSYRHCTHFVIYCSFLIYHITDFE